MWSSKVVPALSRPWKIKMIHRWNKFSLFLPLYSSSWEFLCRNRMGGVINHLRLVAGIKGSSRWSFSKCPFETTLLWFLFIAVASAPCPELGVTTVSGAWHWKAVLGTGLCEQLLTAWEAARRERLLLLGMWWLEKLLLMATCCSSQILWSAAVFVYMPAA